MAEINDTYDVVKAIKAIEDDLIASMIRNLEHHRVEESAEKKQWSQWQVEQLGALDTYKKRNLKKHQGVFDNINAKIGPLITLQRMEGNADQEIAILKAIKDGAKLKKPKNSTEMAAEFFKVNDRKINALIKATTDDVKKGEIAIFRRANDQYRKIIFNAQMYAGMGASYKQAVDMATKDFLQAGINCIEYKNGARHTLSDYTNMALRTAQKRAYLTGEGEKRAEWGIPTVIMNKRGNPCPLCLPWVGKILIDDVWSGGSNDGISPVTGLKYPLMSHAVAKGLYHPSCRDSHTTYFEGISTPPDDKFTKEELNQLVEEYNLQQKQKHAGNMVEKFGRLATYSLAAENIQKYTAREEEWKKQENKLTENILENIVESSTIKSIDVDDFDLMAGGRDISQEALDIISNTIKEYEKQGGMYISEAHFGEFFDKDTGSPALFQIVMNTNGLVDININEKILAGKTIEEIDDMIKGTKINLPQNLKEAVIHECGHAKAYYKKSIADVSKMNEELKSSGVSGISIIAGRDGAECIAEVEVMLSRGEDVPAEAMKLYNKYVNGVD